MGLIQDGTTVIKVYSDLYFVFLVSLSFTETHIVGIAGVVKDLDKGLVKMDDGKYNLFFINTWVL